MKLSVLCSKRHKGGRGRRGPFRTLAAGLCGAVAYMVIANVAFAKAILPFVEMAEPSLAIDSENVSVFNISGENGPFFICDNILDISIVDRNIESHNLPLARCYLHISGNDNFRISCNIFLRWVAERLQICRHGNIVSWRLADISRHSARVSEVPRFPDMNPVSLDVDVSPQLLFRRLLGKSSLVASGYGGIAGRESGDSGEYQGADDKPQTNSPHPQLPVSIIGGPFGGSRHALLFAQISLVMIFGIAAWGPIYLGLRFLAFGNPRIPSDFILTPRFLIGWSRPRLVGFFTLCCGLLVIGGSGWLAWFLRE